MAGDPLYRPMDHDDPELRARGKRELIPQFDPNKQARTMWRNGYSLGDIATIQKRSMGEVYAAINEAE